MPAVVNPRTALALATAFVVALAVAYALSSTGEASPAPAALGEPADPLNVASGVAGNSSLGDADSLPALARRPRPAAPGRPSPPSPPSPSPPRRRRSSPSPRRRKRAQPYVAPTPRRAAPRRSRSPSPRSTSTTPGDARVRADLDHLQRADRRDADRGRDRGAAADRRSPPHDRAASTARRLAERRARARARGLLAVVLRRGRRARRARPATGCSRWSRPATSTAGSTSRTTSGPRCRCRESSELGRCPRRAASALLLGISHALDDAVSQGKSPCEVTPDSVFLDPRLGAMIADLGVAREALGSPAAGDDAHAPWVAPEVLRGEDAHPRSAVYSFGALAYTLLTGRARPTRATRRRSSTAAPPRISDVRPDLPAALDTVFAAAMARDPLRRYATAAEARHLLNVVIYGASTHAARAGRRSASAAPRRLRHAVRRRPKPAAERSLAPPGARRAARGGRARRRGRGGNAGGRDGDATPAPPQTATAAGDDRRGARRLGPARRGRRAAGGRADRRRRRRADRDGRATPPAAGRPGDAGAARALRGLAPRARLA